VKKSRRAAHGNNLESMEEESTVALTSRLVFQRNAKLTQELANTLDQSLSQNFQKTVHGTKRTLTADK